MGPWGRRFSSSFSSPGLCGLRLVFFLLLLLAVAVIVVVAYLACFLFILLTSTSTYSNKNKDRHNPVARGCIDMCSRHGNLELLGCEWQCEYACVLVEWSSVETANG